VKELMEKVDLADTYTKLSPRNGKRTLATKMPTSKLNAYENNYSRKVKVSLTGA
jgi:hypothetical protein